MVLMQHNKCNSTYGKCVNSKNSKLLALSLLANIEAVTFATELAKAMSLHDTVMFLAESVEQISP
jgi:hypothetical protein